MQTITRSASFAASALVSTTWSAMPSSATRLRVASDRAVADDRRAPRPARARRARDRGADQADTDERETVEQRIARIVHAFLPTKSASAVDHQAVRLLGADRHAQRIRQAGRRRPAAGSGRAWSGTRRRPPRCGPWSSGKWISMKLAMLGVTSSPSLRDLFGQPGQPVCRYARARVSTCAASPIAAMPAAIAGAN